jgi:hypothetical protein
MLQVVYPLKWQESEDCHLKAMTPSIKERLIYGRFAACLGFLTTLASKTGFSLGETIRVDSKRTCLSSRSGRY